jgi:fibronectin type 3 domain-containing protein
MEVELSWHSSPDEASRISHFNVYRGSTQDLEPSLLNLVGSPTSTSYTDRPQLNYGGWINRRLEPDTTYYYRIAPVDRWNNQGTVSQPIAVKTLRTSERNAVPLQVQALHAILISDLTPQNYVNLLFRTAPESDVHLYEIHRSNQPAFEIDASTRVGVADANGIVKGSKEYGHVPIDHRMSEYDHMMYQDDTVRPSTTYYYRVCAVDNAGQRSPCSAVASVRTK